MKNSLVLTLALALWVGFAADFSVDSGFSLGLQSAQAAKSDDGGGGKSSGGNSGDRAGGGKSNDRDSGGKSDKANKRDKKDNKAAKKQVKKELRSLNSLGRNINGLINSNSPKLAEFRAIFVNEDGSLKEEVELPDDAEISVMLRDFLGAEPSENAVIDTRARLEILAEQFAELKEKSADEVNDDETEDDDEDEDEEDDDDKRISKGNKKS